MDEKATSLKKELFNKIKNLKINNLISITNIGSFQNIKKLESVNDVDLVIIIKKLTWEDYQEIMNEFNKIAKNLSKNDLKIIVETMLGPIKPSPIKNKKIIQLHLLIYDIEGIRTRRKTVLFDAVNFGTTLYGKALKELIKVENITKENLLEDFNIHLEDLKNNTAYRSRYVNKEGEIKRLDELMELSEEEYLEIYIYHIITAFLNYSRYFNPKLKKDKNLMLKNAKNLLPKEYYEILDVTFKIKEEIRNRNEISKHEILKLRGNGIKFIEFLKKQIE
mgnify:CR=1 FL=1